MHGTFVPRTRWIRSQLTLVLRVYAYTAYSYHRDTAKRRRLGINLRPHLRGFCHRSTGAHSGRCHRHALILLRCRSCGPMPLIRTFAATPLAYVWCRGRSHRGQMPLPLQAPMRADAVEPYLQWLCRRSCCTRRLLPPRLSEFRRRRHQCRRRCQTAANCRRHQHRCLFPVLDAAVPIAAATKLLPPAAATNTVATIAGQTRRPTPSTILAHKWQELEAQGPATRVTGDKSLAPPAHPTLAHNVTGVGGAVTSFAQGATATSGRLASGNKFPGPSSPRPAQLSPTKWSD